MIERGTRRRVVHAGVVVLASLATLVPWAIRTQRLAGEAMLTTTRGAVRVVVRHAAVGTVSEELGAPPSRGVRSSDRFH